MADVLVVTSKVKKYIKESGDCNTSSETVEVLSKAVQKLCEKGMESAKAHGQATIRTAVTAGKASDGSMNIQTAKVIAAIARIVIVKYLLMVFSKFSALLEFVALKGLSCQSWVKYP